MAQTTSAKNLAQQAHNAAVAAKKKPAPVKPRIWHGLMRRWYLRWIGFITFLVLAPFAIAIVVAVAIIDRDITAPSWIKNRIEASAAEFLRGGALEFYEVTVNLGSDLHPRVTIVDTQLTDADGVAIARIPAIHGVMSPRGLVFEREALLQDIQISGTQISLRRNADGTVAVSFLPDDTAFERADSFVELLDQADQIFEQPALAALDQITADGVIINYEDARAGKAYTVDAGEIKLDLRESRTNLRGSFSVLSGGAGVTDLTMTYNSPHGSRTAEIAVTVKDALASDIAAQSVALSWMADINAPISTTIRTSLDEAGRLGRLDASLALGAGAVQPNAATEPLRFDSAKAYVTFEPRAQALTFDQVEIVSDLGRTRASGEAWLKDVEDGLPQTLVGQFRFADTQLNASGLYADGLNVSHAQVDMRLSLDPFAVDLGQVFLETGDVKVLANGRLAATDQGWDVSVDTHIAQLDQADVLRLWPKSAMPKISGWLGRQIPAATYLDLTLAFRKHPNAVPQVAGNFAFEDTEIKFLNSMPPLEDGQGVASFTADTFVVTVDAGYVTAPEGGQIQLAGSTLVMPDLKLDPRPAVYELKLRSSVTAALALSDLPPLSLTSKARLAPDVTAGFVDMNIDLTHPMKKGLVATEVGINVNAVLTDIDSRELLPGRRLTAGRLSLYADKERLDIAGDAIVDGVRLDGEWEQRFDGSGSRLQAGLALSNEALSAFNITLPPGSVSGTTPARLDLRIPARGAAPRYTVTSNLRGLRVAIPAVGWAKAPQTAGKLEINGRLGNAPQVETLSVSGGGLEARGGVTFRSDGSLDRASFSRVQIGNWLNAPITLRGQGANQPLSVEIRGGSVDLRRANFGRGGGGAEGGGGRRAESGPISIALDRLQITEGIALNNFAGEFTDAGGFSGRFTSRINGGAAIQGTVVPQNGRSAVRIVSNDAGGVARSTGLLKTAYGGSLDLTLLPTGGDGTFDGALAIRDFSIHDAPTIAALLDAISVVGLLQQLSGQGIEFDGADARFRLTPEKIILTESSAVGPGLGISLDGIYTLANADMDFQGVLSPFYLVNSIGAIFTRPGEGLIGFNFKIGGTATSPRVSVNPLSALTPGMFRNIFRRGAPKVTQ